MTRSAAQISIRPDEMGDRRPDDLTLRQAATMTGDAPKTLRRATQVGELPRRDVTSERGLMLVFVGMDLQAWTATKQASRHSLTPRERPDVVVPLPAPADLTHLQDLVEECQAMLAQATVLPARRAVAMEALPSGAEGARGQAPASETISDETRVSTMLSVDAVDDQGHGGLTRRSRLSVRAPGGCRGAGGPAQETCHRSPEARADHGGR